MGLFMAYGFTYLSAIFAPGKNGTIQYRQTFRDSHVHGNLFAFLNILIGYFLIHFQINYPTQRLFPGGTQRIDDACWNFGRVYLKFSGICFNWCNDNDVISCMVRFILLQNES